MARREDVMEQMERSQMLLADGFEGALLGYVEGFGQVPVALYDQEKCVEILQTRDGMTKEEAQEYFDFNIAGSYVGDKTPAFATLIKP